jgi:haloalkane dehalogenase
VRPDHPGRYENRLAIAKLSTLDLPVLLPWGDQDAITLPWRDGLRTIFKNSSAPIDIAGAGHFIQEDAGVEVAEHIMKWMKGHS